jgi:hypothetical protein
MARGKKKNRRRKKPPIAVLPLLGGVVAPAMISLEKSNFWNDVQTDPTKAIMGFIDQMGQRYTGFSFMGKYEGFQASQMIPTYTGLIVGMIGSKIATKTGVNRQIKRLPIIGGKIKL